MLIKGDARMRMRLPEIRRLECTDHLKEIVYRCIGERRKRYESADEMIAALRTPPTALKAGVLRTLKGVHVTFTGILSRKRSEAVRAAKRAGADRPQRTVGEDDRRRARTAEPAAGGREGRGIKLMEIKRLREQGSSDHAAERTAVLAARRRRRSQPARRADMKARWSLPRLSKARL